MERTKLKAAREERNLKQEELADAIRCSRGSISLWERGLADPQEHWRSELMTFFDVADPADLDLEPNIVPEQRASEIAMVQQRIEKLNLSRREVLELISSLPAFAGVDLSVLEAPHVVAPEQFLKQCNAAIKACWHLIRSNGFALADRILKECMPTLLRLASMSSDYQSAAAALAVHAEILQGIIVMHCDLDFVGREIHSLAALRFAEKASDVKVLLNAKSYMAFAYINRPLPLPNKAIPIFLDILKLSKGNPLFLQDDIDAHTGLANAYAHNNDEAEALKALVQGENLLSGFSPHGHRDEFYLWKGKTFIELATHSQRDDYYRQAYDTFSILNGQGTAKALCGSAIVQADAMCKLGNLEEFIKCLERGIQFSIQIDSLKRQQEARAVLQKAPRSWQKEQKYQNLVKMF